MLWEEINTAGALFVDLLGLKLSVTYRDMYDKLWLPFPVLAYFMTKMSKKLAFFWPILEHVDRETLIGASRGLVLVKIHSAALNPADNYIQSLGIFVKEWPFVAGSDAAGVVEAIGENVQGLEKGDRVQVFHPSLVFRFFG